MTDAKDRVFHSPDYERATSFQRTVAVEIEGAPTLRQRFALQAMLTPTMASEMGDEETLVNRCRWCWRVADMMLETEPDD